MASLALEGSQFDPKQYDSKMSALTTADGEEFFTSYDEFYVNVEKEEWKLETLCDLYETLAITQSVIFVNTRRKVDWLTDKMRNRDHTVSATRSDINNFCSRQTLDHKNPKFITKRVVGREVMGWDGGRRDEVEAPLTVMHRFSQWSGFLLHSGGGGWQVIYQLILSLGLRRDAALSKALVDFYLASGRHGCAELLVIADSAPFNALLSGYVKRGMFTEALHLFRRMISRSPPGYADCYAYPSVLKARGGLGWILHGQMVHCNVLKSGLLSDVVVTSSAVGMYAKCGLFDSAKLFNEMYVRDVASWNTVMSCFYQDGNPEKGAGVLQECEV
ncbi:hypothetical protein MLD38_000407 [Melastoma candidum]|uniref:Uncharacterized protein n=1 Tax=Melastoma candidum TaxID=119954 RepID=A0ACB9SBX5_9MYRT|nr:hypothetical protein MLD38_000407 [Melastoma candidum]